MAIDEKKLIKALEKRKRKATAFSDIDWNSALKVCIDIVKEQPKVGEWIPCGERLPIICDVYNVTRKISEGKHIFYISDAVYFDGQNTWHSDNRVNHGREYLKDVIAWMPLPEPYKE